MSISAKVIADSVSESGARITTFELRFPRFILPQVLTHRKFSRSARSSRAVPVERLIAEAVTDPVVPLHWGLNTRGMRSKGQLPPDEQERAKQVWLTARADAVIGAQSLASIGVAKEVANRLIEPFLWAYVVVTSTSYLNWFALRMHREAQPEIQALAVAMARAYRDSQPARLATGEWHLPYVTPEEQARLRDLRGRRNGAEFAQHFAAVVPELMRVLQLSVARCARVSYRTHDGRTPTEAEDADLYYRLVGSDPKHASPAEHQAQAGPDRHEVSGNLRGWRQFRKTIPAEAAPSDFDWQSRLVEWDGVDYLV